MVRAQWLLLVGLLSFGCGSQGATDEDLGSFLPGESDTNGEDGGFVNFEAGEVWSALCSEVNEGAKLHWLYVGFQMYEIDVDHQEPPGFPVPNVELAIYDFCGNKIRDAYIGEDATTGFQMEVDEDGFIGYVEYTKPGYPLFRNFDKLFGNFVQVMKLHLFSGVLFDAPLSVVGQKQFTGYIQGGVYNFVDEKPLPGVQITAEVNGKPAGDIYYLPDSLPVPSQAIDRTETTGSFFVVNAPPGQILVTAHLPDGRKVTAPARTWRLDSFERRTITILGIPVYPDMVIEEQ